MTKPPEQLGRLFLVLLAMHTLGVALGSDEKSGVISTAQFDNERPRINHNTKSFNHLEIYLNVCGNLNHAPATPQGF